MPRSLCAGMLFAASGVMLGGVASSLGAAPSNAIVAPPSKDLSLTPNPMRVYKDPQSGQSYAYITFDLLNATGADRRFAPRFELLLDDGVLVQSGSDVPSKVTHAIKSALGDPLVEDQFQVLGTVLEGKENARRGLVVWRMTEREPTEVSVFVTGLSRVSDKNPHPTSGEPLVRRRTMRVNYVIPGDAVAHTTASYEPGKIEWIMR